MRSSLVLDFYICFVANLISSMLLWYLYRFKKQLKKKGGKMRKQGREKEEMTFFFGGEICHSQDYT